MDAGVGAPPTSSVKRPGKSPAMPLRWRYRLNLEVDGSTWEVSLDDWMYLMDEDTLINRSSMSKFGVELGQVTLFFRRQGIEQPDKG